jgi:hypothetical protein
VDLLKPSYATGYAKNASQSAHPNLWDGLVGAWMPSLGVTGETLRDVSGNGNHGTLTNMDAATDWVATSKGLALDMVSNPDYIDAGSMDDFSDELTINIVEKTNAANDGIRISLGSTTAANFGFQNSGSYDLRLFCRPAGQNYVIVNSGAIRSINSFATYSLTFNRGSVKFWKNGKVFSTHSFGLSSLPSSTNELTIGAFAGYSTVNYARQFTSLQLYNRALSPREIKQLYVDSLAPFRTKKRTVVRVPAAIPAATKVGSIKKPTTIAKPSYQAGYARNASESENPQLWDGLVGAWMPSLGVTGETLRDVSGNGNHGTLTNMDAATDWVGTSKGLALDFDGSDDEVLLDKKMTDLVDSGNPITLSAWFRTQRNGIQVMVGNGSSNRCYIAIGIDSGLSAYWGFGSVQNASFTNAQIGYGWHFYAATYDGSVAKGFLDGVQTDQQFIGSQSFATTANISIGRSVSSFPFRGQFGAIRIHNRALSPTEIKQLYVDSLAPFRRKQRVSVAIPAAVTPSATYHPLRSLAHPLEQ